MREAASFIARQSGTDSASVLDSIVGAAHRAFRALSNRRKILSLSDLDDHMLHDLGLTRTDVQRALDLPFMQDPALELQRVALRNRGRGWKS
jgi:uncharacterized protein YjiS (DUF1127 family)